MVDDRNGSWGWGMNPRRVRGGIKARSEKGDFARNWWARRWIQAMEQLTNPTRVQRGQHYARLGQVVSLEETKDGVIALVQGTRPKPYKVTIRLIPLSPRQWNKVLDVLSDQAIFAAQLLAGEMPEDIEEAFSAAGVSLFPQNTHDLLTNCTCPDKANPCKHVAAAHYILGERFDEDPFLLFRMRGRSQTQVLDALRRRRMGEIKPPALQETTREKAEDGIPRLENTLDRFWVMGPEMPAYSVQVKTPAIPQPILKRLGEPDVTTDVKLQGQLEDAYNAISQFALLLAYGDINGAPADEDTGNN